MGNYYQNAVRHPEDIGIGHIRRTITVTDTPPDANGFPIGALEAGAIPLSGFAWVDTVMNGTSPTLDVGIPGTVAGYIPTANVAPTVLGYKPAITAGTLMGAPLAANTIIYAKVGGTSVTTGKIIVGITFVNRRELEGTPFPANP